MSGNIVKMPKVELHLHLDGSVSLELLAKFSGYSIDTIKEKVISTSDSDLSSYLEHFNFINNYLQTKENLELASYTLGRDLLAENVIYAEIRFAPLDHTKNGLKPNDVVNSVLSGLKKSGLNSNLILCMRRGEDLFYNKKVIELANHYLNKGVVAVDLVGDEEHFHFTDYEYLFKLCKYANIPTTIHAGETNKRDILKVIPYTKRIGHGIKIFDDENLINEVINNNTLLEICPNSNLDTKNISTYIVHPIKKLYERGVKVCINTDNRTVSDITLTEEYFNLIEYLNFTYDDLVKMNLNAIDGAFISKEEKQKLKDMYEKKA